MVRGDGSSQVIDSVGAEAAAGCYLYCSAELM
jgi:hypothetical protein